MRSHESHPIFLISGQPKSGKHKLAERLLAAIPTLRQVPTTTDRPPRKEEKRNRRSYHFISPETFNKEKGFIEQATVLGARYGIRSNDVKKAHEKGPIVIIVDPSGAEKISHLFKNERVFGVFVVGNKMNIRAGLAPACANQIEQNQKSDEAIEMLKLLSEIRFDCVITNHDHQFESAFRQLFSFVSEKLQR